MIMDSRPVPISDVLIAIRERPRELARLVYAYGRLAGRHSRHIAMFTNTGRARDVEWSIWQHG